MLREILFRYDLSEESGLGWRVSLFVEDDDDPICTRVVTVDECWAVLGHSSNSAFPDIAFKHFVEDGEFEARRDQISEELLDMLRESQLERLAKVPRDQRTYRFLSGHYEGARVLGDKDFILTNDKTDLIRRAVERGFQ